MDTGGGAISSGEGLIAGVAKALWRCKSEQVLSLIEEQVATPTPRENPEEVNPYPMAEHLAWVIRQQKAA
ncbi:MAG: hypothetical protein EBZ48_07490 [Proteobacteria bacterium]|nr:hypothetical protein [Pseudomonadota bacterium]